MAVEGFRKTSRRLQSSELVDEQRIPGAGSSATDNPSRHTKTKVTINLDGEVVNYFKQVAKEEGRAYQSLINQILREYISGSRPEKLTAEVAQRLLADREFVDNLAMKVSASGEKGEL